MFSLLQKCGLGKVLSVDDLLRLFELKVLRVVRVNGGSDRAAQTMPRPDADDLAQNACLFASADERVSQFMRVAFGQQPFHARGDGVEVGALCPLEVNIRQHLFHHRREGDLAKDDVLSQALLARLALQKLAVDHPNTCKLALPQPEIEQNKQGGTCRIVLLLRAEVHEVRQHNLVHRRGNLVVLRREIEDGHVSSVGVPIPVDYIDEIHDVEIKQEIVAPISVNGIKYYDA